MLSSLSTEDLILKDHPIRQICKVVDEVYRPRWTAKLMPCICRIGGASRLIKE